MIIFLLRSIVNSSFELVGSVPKAPTTGTVSTISSENFSELTQVLWFTSEVYPVVAYTRAFGALTGIENMLLA